MKWHNKTALVTGGAGFIGSSLAKTLLERGAHVVVLDNFAEGPRKNVPNGCDVVEGDIREEESLSELRRIDYVFHFGAPSSIILFNKKPSECVDVTVCGFLNILEWARKVHVKKIVFPSSGSVYGSTPPPQSEDAIVQPRNLYGVAKFACENIAKLYSDKIPIVGMRIFAGYGPGEGHKGEFASPVTLFLNSIIKDERPIVYGNGSQTRDFVYIDDVVDSILVSAENRFSGIVNVGSGSSCSFNEVIRIINNAVGKNIAPIYVDRPMNYLERTLADTGRMKRVLGLGPVGLEVGLRKYLATIKFGSKDVNPKK
jgi:UDP-glucose 4-epimerase